MRILIFAGYYYPHIGGYEKNIHELSKRLVKKGHRVMVVTCNTESATNIERKDKVVIIRLPSLNHSNIPFPKPYIYRLPCADVVMTQTRFFPTSLMGMLYAKVKHIPLIHVERGSCHSVTESKISSLFIQAYDHTIGRLIVESAKVNIGVSQMACNFMHHMGGKMARIVYNGIDVHYEDDDYLIDICFVGRLIYAKGVQDLIVAFEKCCEKHKYLRLIIIGNGDYKQKLERMASESKYKEKIVFYGTQNHENVIRLMARSDIFVNPSYSEGLPTSVMEAASIGKPIIATEVGGTNEIIDDGESGMLYKPHDVDKLTELLDWMIDNHHRAMHMGIEALKSVSKKFSWDDITNEYDRIIKEVCLEGKISDNRR